MLEVLLAIWITAYSFVGIPPRNGPSSVDPAHVRIKWASSDQMDLKEFYVYRKGPKGWASVADAVPVKPSGKYTRRDYDVECGRFYTYLLRAVGTQNGEQYFETIRVKWVFVPCE